MKIQRETVTKTVQEVEVTLPYFSKNDEAHFAIISEETAIRASYKEFKYCPPVASVMVVTLLEEAKNGEPITQAEFESIYIKANDYLSEQFESLRDVKSGTTVDDVLKNMDA